ncbi:uncharacterized protein BDR25DRAFT_369600 [Lindgomyces ingoldianus]|uniref:Uncharacterized protein n=1 Tax=Lindgomyces ingoldianus TaxID=673940 RepID=A0ACB6QV64_9PLEO|nr:uncharacterized protein BDR25DRAFT_369600 [Lindgomyces ingoldianus]KAF2470410.1 hypothetical protein BDR25DRAFT_369600 [Lindgomyces ingoldianus]
MARSQSIPNTLPPPYTATSTRSASLRTTSSTFSTTSELLIGPLRTRFLLHTSLLITQSPYFRACLTGPFLESTANNNSVTLPDISVDVFELCVAWLYTGYITPVPFKDGKPAYYVLLNLWIVADRLCFEGLRNAVLDLMADLSDRTNSVLTPSDTRILYSEAVPEGARIRKLVLDLFAFKNTDKLLSTHADPWHAGFLRDLCVRLKRPTRQAMLRHRFRLWCPESWHATRACEGCRSVLPPKSDAVCCEECACAWCTRCVKEGVAVAACEDRRGTGSAKDEGIKKGVERKGGMGSCGGAGNARKWEACKPWRGSRCRVYHEHRETENCGEMFMGL